MAVMAMLHGLTPAPVESCRVLEVACGDGANLIPLAYATPSAEFVGFDLAGLPVERGQRRIAELGLKNIRLVQMDLLQTGAELGRFDYIMAHGLYSWSPAPVGDRLLALAGELLTDDGVAFVSFNALPGGYLRTMTRDMMLFGAGGVEDPAHKVAEGFRFLRCVMEALPENDVYRALIQSQLLRMEKHDPRVMYHDVLTDAYHPVYFTEFVEHARRRGLEYLSDAQLPAPSDCSYRIEAESELATMAGPDFLRHEQMLDFVRVSAYREALLCRQGRAIRRGFPAEHFRRLLFATSATPAPGQGANPTAFVLPGGMRMESNHPKVAALLLALAAAWPRAVSWDELEPQIAHVGFALDADSMGLIMRLAIPRMVELRCWNPPVARVIAERPRASACSRQESLTSSQVTSLLHTTGSFDNAKIRRLLALLDGTRDRRALLDAMIADFPEESPQELEEGIERGLQLFLQAGVLEG